MGSPLFQFTGIIAFCSLMAATKTMRSACYLPLLLSLTIPSPLQSLDSSLTLEESISDGHVCVNQKGVSDDSSCSAKKMQGENVSSSREAIFPQCDLFLAPSTIPGAGLGVFVGSTKQEGDIVGLGDVAIPLIDLLFHHGRRPIPSIMDDYEWMGHVMGMGQESVESDAICPGIDAAVNCNFALINIDKGYPSYDTHQLHRSKHPGAGASTPYVNATTTVIQPIPQGGELFKNYGTSWFTTRPQIFGKIPFEHDYHVAEAKCRQWHNLDISDQAKDDLWRLVDNVPWESRSVNALPSTAALARQAATEGIRSLYQPQGTRPVSYLHQQGRCMDNIRYGPSELAGRGGFATRSFVKGQVITGTPLLHMQRSYLTMYEEVERDGEMRRSKYVSGQQLLLNYCFGHMNSTLLLFPYSSGVAFINHNQTLANVRVQWAPQGSIGHDASWLERTPKEFVRHYSVGLAIDFVATRDIKEGEELFMDYGDAWQEAWLQHVEDWEPDDDPDYSPAAVFTQEQGDEPLRTQDEEPYPENILLRCHPYVHNPKLEERVQQKILKGTLWSPNQKGWDCRILDRYWYDNEEYYYTVEIDVQNTMGNFMKTDVREDVPRGAIIFVDDEYTTDIHLEGAFRHEIHLPDDMVPEIWRDL